MAKIAGLEKIVQAIPAFYSRRQAATVVFGLVWNSTGHSHRELKARIEHDKEPWAQAMTRLLRIALPCRHFHEHHAIPVARIKRLTNIYNKIIRDGLAYHEALPRLPCKGKQGRQPRRTGHNLLLRLFHYKQDVLRFLHDPAKVGLEKRSWI